MGPKRFYSQNCSLFIVKFQKLGFSAPLIEVVLKKVVLPQLNKYNYLIKLY